ncbi:BadF/BadG/BcrA/BcrD ATPase family protein [Acidipropionibacterium acidipropionici ATCC 4875]|uniref:BadF/BadG/BcrA/BcrD ATPase family protein n=1 Tax=Acidipropionibacterium acidipropionici (strain ATCC 4875 / DSM 20272 / JCM 6432 / NBRC 12425 / NCIMB 8070 / 4) TaxID=1171373 RepID=K7RSX2_ACIA4|nr:BadF/BadG/BcrA/BcrD ATPase family protein [Acidipropionibacterium acidipropionici ATCC 4875]
MRTVQPSSSAVTSSRTIVSWARTPPASTTAPGPSSVTARRLVTRPDAASRQMPALTSSRLTASARAASSTRGARAAIRAGTRSSTRRTRSWAGSPVTASTSRARTSLSERTVDGPRPSRCAAAARSPCHPIHRPEPTSPRIQPRPSARAATAPPANRAATAPVPDSSRYPSGEVLTERNAVARSFSTRIRGQIGARASLMAAATSSWRAAPAPEAPTTIISGRLPSADSTACEAASATARAAAATPPTADLRLAPPACPLPSGRPVVSTSNERVLVPPRSIPITVMTRDDTPAPGVSRLFDHGRDAGADLNHRSAARSACRPCVHAGGDWRDTDFPGPLAGPSQLAHGDQE